VVSERELIGLVARRFAGAPVRRGDVGIGDDCAVLRAGSRRLLVTTDLMVESVHFDLAWMPPYLLGRKALAAGLSDIAAMGGTPRGAFVSIALPRRAPASLAREIAAGFHDGLRDAKLPLLGGDTSASPGPLFIDVTSVGEASRNGPVLRSGARPGDGVWVSGALGASALGLELLKRGLRPWSWRLWSDESGTTGKKEVHRRACFLASMVHLVPHPRLALGRLLASRGLASAMIDLSDGLSTDLHNLCEASRVGARLEEGRIPVHAAVRVLAPRRGVELALSGGEDYELLFTVPRRRERSIEALVQARRLGARRIGRIRRGAGRVVLTAADGRERRLPRAGYEHFRRR